MRVISAEFLQINTASPSKPHARRLLLCLLNVVDYVHSESKPKRNCEEENRPNTRFFRNTHKDASQRSEMSPKRSLPSSVGGISAKVGLILAMEL